MNKELPIIKVEMFGKEAINYNGAPLLHVRNTVTKAVKLLLILLYSGEAGISRNDLIENLYGREEKADVSNNLRVTVHRLRKMLLDAGLPEADYIESNSKTYRWVSPVKTEVDVLEFKNLVEKANQETDDDIKAMYYQKACALYKGEFLERLSGEEWVLLENLKLKRMFEEIIEWVSSYLIGRGEYDELLILAERACALYPFDEWQALKIECLIAMNRYEEAMEVYNQTARLFHDELGIAPPSKMAEQFETMSRHMNGRTPIITEIKETLQEADEDGGAFFCTAPSFRDAYQMMRRSMERSGQSVFLMLCTIKDDNGHAMQESQRLDNMSRQLHKAIKASLRKCDSFTKFSSAQYLIMLTGINEENCDIVRTRIVKAFSAEHKSWAKHLECGVSSLYDV